MKNSNFIIEIDENTGFVTSIMNPKDEHGMNWCSDLGDWGKIQTEWQNIPAEYNHDLRLGQQDKPFTLISIENDDERMSAVYETHKYNITINRFFNEKGNLVEQVIVKNITDCVICINRDNFGIEFPFNDKYTFADECMTNRCNTHIWCGYNSSWVNALRMGASDINLGLVLTKGSFVSYRQTCCAHISRGCFILEPESIFLKSNEEYIFEWELFWHTGKKDFFEKLSGYESYIGITAKHFTVFEGEKIEFEISTPNNSKPSVFCGGEMVDVTEENGRFFVSYTSKMCGEYKFIVECGELRTYAEFLVKIPFAELAKKRLHFVTDNQQCKDKESPLYGAYLIYDNKIESTYFDALVSDHNACRERLNMPFAIIRYLQLQDDEKLRESIDLYMEFVFREFYEESTGEVFNNIGKSRNAVRLYNAPGVMLLFTEMYYLTKDSRYLDNILKLAEKYYSIGGEKCYSNGVTIARVVDAFKLAGRIDDMNKLLGFFKLHVNTMLKNGVSYPKHEVNYEQTIVTPAVKCISEMGLYCEDKEFYIDSVAPHLECLDRFSGNQPSFHLNEIAIRFWDAFWFGKSQLYGDTLPHHLSTLTARAFMAYATLTGDRSYIDRAEECVRNCMCLISDDGRGSAAYVYPHRVNGMKGEFYDEWANDQDLVLYDAMSFCGISDAFKL